ncbi:transposase family protein [Frankia sp. Cr1]|uniref:transposase family protein n=1 Tax=Frankia sp. Cr1 TaxID=3073931 RepID=UPI003A1029A9
MIRPSRWIGIDREARPSRVSRRRDAFGCLQARRPCLGHRGEVALSPRRRGYQGCSGMVTPRKRPPEGERSEMDKKCNAELSALRAPVERVVAQFKSWRILHTDCRCPYHTYHDATRGLFFFSISWGFE